MSTDNLINVQDAQQVATILQNAGIQKLGMALLILIVLLIVSHFIVRLVKHILANSKYINKSLHTLLTYGVRYTLILLSVMIAANSVGVPITTFIALFSIIGVAVSLAIQGVLSNIAGCLIIVTGHKFEVGDFIETGSGSGTVKDISLLHTQLQAPDGTMIFIPNTQLYTAPVTNITSSGRRRIAQVYSASYQHTPEQMRQVLTEALSQLTTLLPDPAPNIVVDSCSYACVQYKIICWTDTADYWPTLQKLNELVYQSYAAHQINWVDPGVRVTTTQQ